MIPKFRAWDKKTKIMYEVKSIVFTLQSMLCVNRKAVHPERTLYLDDEDTVLMQSTGLFDKNGVEIFDGDVLKFNDEFAEYDTEGYVDGSSEGFNYVEIIRTKDGFGFGKTKISESSLEIQIEDDFLKFSDCIESGEFNIEVIGNIYENPDLLESVEE